MKTKLPLKLLLFLSVVLTCLAVDGCRAAPDFDSRLGEIVRPYTFDFVRWELAAIPAEIEGIFTGEAGACGVEGVRRYFADVERMRKLEAALLGGSPDDRAALEAELTDLRQYRRETAPVVADVIARQIQLVLVQHGIHNPAGVTEAGFPPVSFTLEPPPYLLVVSPRDRIDSMREVALRQDIALEAVELIEAEVEVMDVSALVVPLGGYGGTYPTFVADAYGLRFTLDAAVEEWLHQYLTFTPLGFAYALDTTGISRNYEIAVMNETVVGIASTELGADVYRRFYSEDGGGEGERDGNEEFNREMRQIRQTVDRLLAAGEIEAAEGYMEERRQYLQGRGYYIRKLNQAYFAFHGTYADEPTSVSPIGAELNTLREQSTSVKDFLDVASRFTSRADLQQSLKQAP